MTKTEIITLINLWIDFQNEDQPGAPRDGEKRIEWFAEKNQSGTGREQLVIEAFIRKYFDDTFLVDNDWDYQYKCFTESTEYKAIPASESDRDEILECLYDVFYQSCMHADGKFDNLTLSAYESAQDLLIRLGKIKESDCYRK